MFSRDEFKSYVNSNLSNRINVAKKSLVKQIISDTDILVPYDTGKLASDIDYIENNNGIRYTAEYAPFVLDMPAGTNFNRESHTQATSNWTGISYSENKEKWYKKFESEVK